MPVPLFHSIASWFLKKRIHQMELFIKYPIEVQKELLDTLIKNIEKFLAALLVEHSNQEE